MKNKFVNLNLYSFLFEGEVKPLGGDQLVETIYQDALKWAEENKDAYEEAQVNDKSLLKEKIYETPIGPSLNLSSQDILNGAVLFKNLNVGGTPVPKFVASQFDYQTRRFKEEFLSNYKNMLNEEPISLMVLFSKLSENKKLGGAFFSGVSKQIWNNFVAKMEIDPIARPGEQIKSTIRHELQHGTQNINSICLAYARALKDPKITDISSIKEIYSNESAKGSYGVGSTITGLQQSEAETTAAKYSADPQGDKIMQDLFTKLGNDPKWIAYLGDDTEYTTWKSDTLDSIMRFVQEYSRLFDRIISNINMKEFGNLAAQPRILQSFPQNREFYKQAISSPERRALKENFNFISRPATSIADLANLLMKDFLKSPSLITRKPSTDDFVKVMMSMKPKEFVRNMTIDLTKRLKDYAEQKGQKLASHADQSMTQQRGAGRSDASIQQSQQNIQRQQQQQQQAAQISAQKQQTALQQRNMEQQFRSEKNVVPRNPRKHLPDMNFDENTGARILPPEQYREQLKQWLATKNQPQQQPTVQTESVKLHNFLYN